MLRVDGTSFGFDRVGRRWRSAVVVTAFVAGLVAAAGVQASERKLGDPDLWVASAWDGSLRDSASGEPLFGPRFELRRAHERTVVYWEPRRGTPRRAWIGEGAVFEVGGRFDGSGCDSGWTVVRGGGYVCLDGTEPAEAESPRLAAPRPGRPLLFRYAARAGDPAFSYAFSHVGHDDEGDEVLMRPHGRPLDASRYEIHTPSRLRGRDLRTDPVPRGTLPAWSFVEAAPVYPLPSDEVEPAGHLAKHTAIVVDEEPVDESGHWWRIPDGLGPGRDGYVDDRTAIRHWSPAPAVEGVQPHEIWIDLDLDQQVLALRRGATVIYATLVSTGIDSRATPVGLFRIRDKRAWTSMGSRPSSEDQYFVEKVPWTMYFRDYYAIHGAYWHDVFGTQRSHGCVNVAPRDAEFIYRAVSPRTETGFMWTYASEEAPGSLVRIREGDRPVRDRTAESY